MSLSRRCWPCKVVKQPLEGTAEMPAREDTCKQGALAFQMQNSPWTNPTLPGSHQQNISRASGNQDRKVGCSSRWDDSDTFTLRCSSYNDIWATTSVKTTSLNCPPSLTSRTGLSFGHSLTFTRIHSGSAPRKPNLGLGQGPSIQTTQRSFRPLPSFYRCRGVWPFVFQVRKPRSWERKLPVIT